MQKSAQSKRELGRGIGSWLKDIPSAISGKATEKYFNPEFLKVMTSLRKVDNNLRSIISGESVGTEDGDNGDPGKYKTSLKTLLKQIKSNLNRREYMVAAADLGRFHAKLFEIANQINSLDNRVNELHNQFLFGTQDNPILSEEQWEHLQDLKKRYAAAKRKDILVKEAGLKDIADFFHNITNDRGRSLAAYEKRYGKKTEKMKKDAIQLLKEGEALVGIIIATFKELASFRATRNPDKYIERANQLVKKFEGFDARFKEFYTTSVKGLLEKADSIYATKKAPEAKEMGEQKLPVDGPAPSGPAASEVQIPEKPKAETIPYFGAPPQAPPARNNTMMGIAPPAPGSAPGSSPEPAASKIPTDPSQLTPPDEFSRSTEEEKKLREKAGLPPATTDKEFYDSLTKVAKQHPNLLKSYISKYARSIQSSDPETALKLFKIALQTEE